MEYATLGRRVRRENNYGSTVHCVAFDLSCMGTFAIRQSVFAGDCFVRIFAVVY